MQDTQSQPSKGERLSIVDDLRSAWPPGALGRSGYLTHPALSGEVIDALELPLPGGVLGAVCLTRDDADQFAAACVVRRDAWAGAVAGDGLTTQLLQHSLAGSWSTRAFSFVATLPLVDLLSTEDEIPILVEQTHQSVVFGNLIVKWLIRPDLRGDQLLRQEHLTDVGFESMARHYGHLVWEHDGHRAILAMVDHYISGAADGWEWCLNAAQRYVDNDTSAEIQPEAVGQELAQLLADLHRAMATPTKADTTPLKVAPPTEVQGWQEAAILRMNRAHGHFAEDLRDRGLLGNWRFLNGFLEALPPEQSSYTTLTHGDLHVGQILKTPDGELFLVDFEGDPLALDRGLWQSPLRDAAHLITSLALVGEFGASEGVPSAALTTWTRRTCQAFLRTYESALAEYGLAQIFSRPLLELFIAEQISAELNYSAEVLPGWAYAPLGLIEKLQEVGLLSTGNSA